MALHVRPAVQAGRFYEGNPQQLGRTIDGLLASAKKAEGIDRPIGLVSPHAGYIYSGQTAAYAYKQLEGHAAKRVILAGPSHYARVDGACIYKGEAYSTPLGETPLDQDFIERLSGQSNLVQLSRSLDSEEHSLEVQLPFLQRALDDFKLAPLMLGQMRWDDIVSLADSIHHALAELDDADRTVLVASSDLYHGHSHDECKTRDSRLAEALETYDVDTFFSGCKQGNYMACGAMAIALTMLVAQKCGAQSSRVLYQTTSRDAYPVSSSDYVVGYLAAAFY